MNNLNSVKKTEPTNKIASEGGEMENKSKKCDVDIESSFLRLHQT